LKTDRSGNRRGGSNPSSSAITALVAVFYFWKFVTSYRI